MLGTRIAALRREAGLSQAELAQRLQVSPSALGMYEQERREPSMQKKCCWAVSAPRISGWSSAGSVPSPGKSWRSCLPPC